MQVVSLEALPASNHINKSGVDKERGHNESFSSILLCADGKGPLLEGEGNVLPCAGECPQGFDCELFSSGDRTGICCPNVTELFKLYSTESSSDSLPEVLEASGFTMESRDEGAAYTQRQELHPDKAALSLIQASRTDIRQRPLGHRPLQTPNAAAVLRGRASADSVCVEVVPPRRACLSYPWGYCPGQPVASDVTLRTKEECELLCLVHNMPQQQQQHQKEDKMVGPPLTSREFDSVERETGPFDLSSPESIRLIAGNEGHKQVKAAQQTETNVLRFDHRSGFSSGVSANFVVMSVTGHIPCHINTF
uniref:Uncharacterized protein n=1 Tax=Ditylenchus dipsaci TaxID=166011 RepID=A0A915DZ43_9BILA